MLAFGIVSFLLHPVQFIRDRRASRDLDWREALRQEREERQ